MASCTKLKLAKKKKQGLSKFCILYQIIALPICEMTDICWDELESNSIIFGGLLGGFQVSGLSLTGKLSSRFLGFVMKYFLNFSVALTSKFSPFVCCSFFKEPNFRTAQCKQCSANNQKKYLYWIQFFITRLFFYLFEASNYLINKRKYFV